MFADIILMGEPDHEFFVQLPCQCKLSQRERERERERERKGGRERFTVFCTKL